MPVSTHTTANINSEWSDLLNRSCNVITSQTTSQEERNLNRLAYSPAQFPIVRPSRTTKLFYGEGLIPRVQQDSVHCTRHLHRFIYRLRTCNVNYLDQ